MNESLNSTEIGGNETSPILYIPTFVDPFEICSSSVLILVLVPTCYIFVKTIRWYLYRGFKTSFQRLYFVCLINDMILVFTQLLGMRLPWWGVMGFYGYSWIAHGLIPTILYYFFRFATIFQTLVCLAVALNRMCAIVIPQRFEQLWRQYRWPIFGFLYAFPQIFSLDVLFTGAFFLPMSEAAFILWSDNEKWHAESTCVIMIFVGFTALIVNIITGIFLLKHYKNKRMNSRKWRVEIRFYSMSIVIFLCQMGAASTQFLVAILPAESSVRYWALETAPIVSDLNSLLPLYFLVLVSGEMKKIIYDKPSNYSVTSIS